MLKYRLLLFFALSVAALKLTAQTVTMEKIELAGELINVYYSLDDSNPNHEYQIDLYSSKDNFAEPLTKVSGEVGAEIKPGVYHMISWNAYEEIGGYEGELALEIRARVYIPFVKITGFDAGAKFKRGQAYPLLWKSGNMGGQIDIELYRDQSRVGGDRNVPNSGKYEYAFEGSAKPGKDYRLKFTNTRNRDEATYTGYFQIVPKIPIVIKVGALAGLAAGAYLLLNSSGGSESGGSSAAEPLAGHPDFPDP